MTGIGARWACGPVVLALIAVLTAGCSDAPDEPTLSPEAAIARIAALPSLEKTEEQMMSVIEEVGAAATGTVPELRWEWMEADGSVDCYRPYDRTGGRIEFLPHYVASGVHISDEQWPALFEATRAVAARVGATDVSFFHNGLDEHDVSFRGEDGTLIRILAADNTVIAAKTGCRFRGTGVVV